MAWSVGKIEKNYACNGELIKFLRESLGLTQEQLAEKSGYTDRLIRKAEASQTLSANTIDVLSDALSTPENTIYPEDLVNSPRELAISFVEGIKRYGPQIVANMRDRIDDDMTCFAAGDPEIFPFAGEYQSIKGFDDFWRQFYSVFSLTTDPFSNLIVVAEGTRAMAKFDAAVIHLPSNRIARSWIILQLEFRRGKLVRFEDYFDTSGEPPAELTPAAKGKTAFSCLAPFRTKSTQATGECQNPRQINSPG
ncbi:MAG: helix-turn-helix domain-containing protein [Pirellulales bacterium]|nr:helix-turn-helix domain-containing protein [Pirellulales bacterium]